MKKQKRREEKGITLVALVVTIIVLIILAGVTLNIVLDNVYAIVSQGEIDYYAVIQNQTINLVDFIYQQQSGSVNENSTNNNNGNENVNTSNTANTSNTNNLL